MAQVPYAVAHRVEEAFVALLRSSETLAGIDIVAASNREAVVAPLHCFVLCVDATGQGSSYKARVQIAVVSNIDDTDHAERRRWTELVMSQLTSVDNYDYAVQIGDTAPSLSLLGPWVLGAIQPIGDGQQTGDVIPVVCGVLVPVGAAEDGTATTV